MINLFRAAMIAAVLIPLSGNAQDLVIDEKDNLDKEVATATVKVDTTNPSRRFKVDGIAAVVGNAIVLDSDIDKAYIELQAQNISTADITRCSLLGKMMEDKLYAHHAVLDSIVVSEREINNYLDQQIQYMVGELGSEEKVYQYYRRNSMEELRRELFEINKANRLVSQMQEKVIADLEITPEEVRQFFYSIPDEDRPIFGTELEVAQIVVEPKISEESRRKVIAQLQEFRRDILDRGASFTSRAVLYSQDPGSAAKGGLYTIDKNTQFIKEFKDIAFSLQEGEISEPFETEFGFHILTVDKIRGQERDVRHILLIPEVDQKSIDEAKAKIEDIRNKIVTGQISFSEAAMASSDEKETRNSGGQLVNPVTGDTRFELNKMDPALSAQVYDLKDNEVSPVFVAEGRSGRKSFKILTVTNRHEERVADYARDYEKIKELALNEKRIRTIEKWQKEKISETYIHVDNSYQDCEFSNNWLKN